MNILMDMLDRAGELWWHYALHATWQAAIVVALIVLAVRLGKRWPSPLRYWLLVVALLKFAIPPMLSIPTGVFSHAGPKIAFEPTATTMGKMVEERVLDEDAAADMPVISEVEGPPIEIAGTAAADEACRAVT